MSKIFAVIAAKNEGKNIYNVVLETKKHVDSVIVVDDGSNDTTNNRAQAAGAKVLTHIVNLGKGAAIKTGCEYAIANGAQTIVLLDGDGQHEPKEIPNFLSALKDADLVFGYRTRRKSMPAVLKFGNWLISRVTIILYGINIIDSQSGYRAFHACIYPKIRWQSSDYSMESEMIANAGRKRIKYAQIPISTIYSDKYKGTTVIDGIKIVSNMVWWKLTRW